MAVDQAPPLMVVGMEGAWGTLLMVSIVFPWASMLPGADVGGCMESVYDSYIMIQNSHAVSPSSVCKRVQTLRLVVPFAYVVFV